MGFTQSQRAHRLRHTPMTQPPRWWTKCLFIWPSSRQECWTASYTSTSKKNYKYIQPNKSQKTRPWVFLTEKRILFELIFFIIILIFSFNGYLKFPRYLISLLNSGGSCQACHGVACSVYRHICPRRKAAAGRCLAHCYQGVPYVCPKIRKKWNPRWWGYSVGLFWFP